MSITSGRVAENRRARHDYQIEETVEAGLVLTGSEVKSLRTGRASIAESYAGEDRGKLCLFNANIPVYPAARDNHEPKRVRQLLVSGKERDKLLGMIAAMAIPSYHYLCILLIVALQNYQLAWHAAAKSKISEKHPSNGIGIDKSKDFERALDQFKGDRCYSRQVSLNLVKNSIKHRLGETSCLRVVTRTMIAIYKN